MADDNGGRRGWHPTIRSRLGEAMPLEDGLPDRATLLYDELKRLNDHSVSGIDFVMYNFGTGIALAATGAAAVTADVNAVVAASLSAVAAFFIAITRSLSFGKRWAFGLERRARYAGMIYELNRSVGETENVQKATIDRLYDAMRTERARDAELPGVTDTNT